MRKVLVVAALALSLSCSGVLANTVKISDAQGDTENVENPKDIRSVTAGHTASGKLKFTIVFWNRNSGNDYRPSVYISHVANDPDAYCDKGYDDLYQLGNTPKEVVQSCGHGVVGSYKTLRPNAKTFIYKVSKSAIGSPTVKFFFGVRSQGDHAPEQNAAPYMYGWELAGAKHKL